MNISPSAIHPVQNETTYIAKCLRQGIYNMYRTQSGSQILYNRQYDEQTQLFVGGNESVFQTHTERSAKTDQSSPNKKKVSVFQTESKYLPASKENLVRATPRPPPSHAPLLRPPLVLPTLPFQPQRGWHIGGSRRAQTRPSCFPRAPDRKISRAPSNTQLSRRGKIGKTSCILLCRTIQARKHLTD